ncbi:MAG: O-antigen ligase family protein [Verrucomicrobia bacterium]|nr:O-antigen ligase family protein [Verrucomicrobiota bacterium]
MSRLEKLTMGILTGSVVMSATLYGVWEDKLTLWAPLLTLTYLAATCSLIFAVFRRNPSGFRTTGKDSGSQFSASGWRTPPGGVWLLLFWLYSCALIPFSVLPYEAKISSLGLGVYLAIYWVSANLLARFSYRKVVWGGLFVSCVFIALYSLVQHKVAPNLIFGVERYTDSWTTGRLGGTYQCPNHIAHLFQMWLPFCFVFLFMPQFGWFWRICFAYAIPLFLLLIYQTQSRAGLLGAVAAVGTTALFMILRKSRRAFFIALLAVPLLCVGVVGGLWAGSSIFRSRMQPVVGFVTQCLAGDFQFTDSRPQAWLDTIPMIADRPVCGFGPGNYGPVYEEYRERVKAVRVEMVHAHNEYLELLAEYGLVGGLLVLCLLITVCVKLIRFIRTADRSYHALPAVALLGALAGTAVHGFFDFELRIFPNALMLSLFAGCAVAPLMQTTPVKGPGRSAVPQWIVAVTVLLAAIWSVQVMSSSWIRIQGDRALLRQEFQRAERIYKTAEKIDSQNWLAEWGLGQVYYHYRYYELDPARKQEWALNEKSSYTSAYRTNPKKEEVAYGLGRVELFLGNRDKGLDYLRQAANYKRFNDFYWRKLGIELRQAGLYEESLSAFVYAQKLDSSNPTVKRNIQWLNRRKAAPVTK